MKDNILQNIITLAFKYIWLLCTLLIFAEIIGTTYTANVLLKETSHWVIQSTEEEITSNINNVRHLLVSMAGDKRLNDPTVPLRERAITARAYRDGYNLFMIGIVDKNYKMITTNHNLSAPVVSDVSDRGFIVDTILTGRSHSTDLIVSGIDNKTLVINIATPMIEGGIVQGAIVGSINFDNIQEIIDLNNARENHQFLLLSKDMKIATSKNDEITNLEKEYMTTNQANTELIINNIKNNISGQYWASGTTGPTLISYSPIPNTPWILFHSAGLSTIIITLLPMFILKIAIYIFLCLGIYIFSKLYLQKHLSSVNLLIDKIGEMQKEIFKSEHGDFAEILALSEQGLSDKLTGLHTRTLAVSLMNKVLHRQNSYGALLFIDFDDLKPINDNFGHSAGDDALIAFSQALKVFLAENDSILGRYGGDEFILLIKNIKTNKEYYTLTGKLRNQLDFSVKSSNYVFSIHASIGGVLYTPEHHDLETLIHQADQALYQAKKYGKNKVYLYTPEMEHTQ